MSRRQFSLQVAAGKTIHKSQGSTLKGVVINFEGRKTEHIHYVGLSRVQNLNSAYILNLNEKKSVFRAKYKRKWFVLDKNVEQN